VSHTPLIAIVGRPNVGKSTLFNALAGKQIAIVDDQPGVTRDRVYRDIRIGESSCMLVDTGGLISDPRSQMELGIRDQALLACDEADIILFLVDGRVPPTNDDEEISALLFQRQADVMLIANKIDNESFEESGFRYQQLGLGTPFFMSALKRRNFSRLKKHLAEMLPEQTVQTQRHTGTAVSIIGKPNVGKSSLFNRLVGETRAMVDDLPGTTRDAVDTSVIIGKHPFRFIDTAGIRRRNRRSSGIPYFSYLRALKGLHRCDVAVLVFDATSADLEIVEVKLAHQAMQTGKAVLIAVNKWDLLTGDDNARKRWIEILNRRVAFLGKTEPRFISAKSGRGITRLPDRIVELSERRKRNFDAAFLNNILDKALARTSPPTYHGREIRIYRLTQLDAYHPKFALYASNPSDIPERYIRYLRKTIRKELDLNGIGFDLHIRHARN